MMEVQSLAPFEKTVAGSTPFLFAQNFPGRVFKPAHPAEKAFYESIDKHPQLKTLVPKYHGTLSYMPKGDEHQAAEYLVMEDLTHGFTHPCILDVKLGTTHHDIDFTNPQKHPPRQSKYLTAPVLGFCLTGMQVYKSEHGRFEYMDKVEGRHLTSQTVVDKLFYFFLDGQKVRRDVIQKFIYRLTQVASYFQNKPAYTFRSSSLLLLYEGKRTAESADRVEVKMIDFAHAKRLPISPDVDFKDEYGYLYGTNNFIKILELLQTRPEPELPILLDPLFHPSPSSSPSPSSVSLSHPPQTSSESPSPLPTDKGTYLDKRREKHTEKSLPPSPSDTTPSPSPSLPSPSLSLTDNCKDTNAHLC